MSQSTVSPTIIHVISDERSGRIRKRKVACGTLAERAAARCAETGKPAIRVAHGGTVANAYGYPADTEAVCVVALPIGGAVHVALYGAQIPANKATLSGAASATLPAAAPLVDGRYGQDARTHARRQALRIANRDIGIALAGAVATRKQAERAARRRTQAAPKLRERLEKYRIVARTAHLTAAGYVVRHSTHSSGSRPGTFDFAVAYGDGRRVAVSYHALPTVAQATEDLAAQEVAEAARLAEWRRSNEEYAALQAAEAARREEDYARQVEAATPRLPRFTSEGGIAPPSAN